jgi:hypothetical protein
MVLWKRLAIIGVSFGAGFAVVISLIIGGVAWYSSRAKPWNTAALRATFDGLGTEGDAKSFAFYYVVENTTPADYRITDKSGVFVTGKLRKEKALGSDTNYASLDLPVYVPAKRRVRVGITVPFPFKDECAQELEKGSDWEDIDERHRTIRPTGEETIGSLALRIRRRYKGCGFATDENLVARAIKLYPVYRDWLKPEERERRFLFMMGRAKWN